MRIARRSAIGLAVLFTLSACSRDTGLPPPPPPPGPGSISGKVVRALPGTGDRVPVEGAAVYVLNTGLRTTTEVGGTLPGSFQLTGVDLTAGDLLIRWDSNGDGTPDQQRLLRLQDLGTGPGRQVNVGEVSVVENARIHGRVLLGDVAGAGGHTGTAVFVSHGPFAAFTGDDGSFVLDRLAAGMVSISIARAGYKPVTLADLSLQAGQDLALLLVTLEKDTSVGASAPGGIQGQLDFSPVTAAASSARVTASDGAGSTLTANPDSSGAYALTGVAPGLYQLRMALAGYADATVANVLVGPGATATVATVLMAPPPAADPGTPTGSGGGSASCPQNAPCQPTDPCQVGMITCPGGTATCAPIAAALNGTSCGPGMVCNSGSCASLCAPGAACASATDPCHQGVVACSAAGVSCNTAGQPAMPNGTACGAGAVCHAGVCGPCAVGAACALSPPSPCQAAATSCDTGLPVCTAVATLADGTSCGANQVCHAGSCNPCTAGSSCTPSNSCHAGATSCGTGLPACGDSGVALVDGSTCGPDLACHAGSCGACAVGAACDGTAGHGAPPASPDPCRSYATLCGTGLPACAVSGNAPDGAACGTTGSGNVCRAGLCGPAGNVLRLLGAPHALPNQVVPAVTLQLVDSGGLPVLTPVTVAVTAPPGAVAPPAAATSSADGTVTFTGLRLGRQPGPQGFQASGPGVAAALSFTVLADAPADGTILPLVNAAHVNTPNNTATGPAPALPMSTSLGVAVATDGTVYFSEDGGGAQGCFVKRISPAGDLDVVAGNGNCGDPLTASGAARAVPMMPHGLAVDDARGLLYVADNGSSRIRVVSLASGLSTTLAGNGAGGCSGSPDCGEGLTGSSVPVPQPESVLLGPESPPAVFFTDASGRVRKVDTSSGIVTTVLRPGTCVAGGPLVAVSLLDLALDEGGTIFASGMFCGGDYGTTQFPAVARQNTNGTLFVVAGGGTGLVVPGATARSVQLAAVPYIAFDRAPVAGGGTRSNLWLSAPSSAYVARVDAATNQLDIVVGTGTAGIAGDFGPAGAALVNTPSHLAFHPGRRDLYLADGLAYTVAMVAGAAPTSATPLPTLAAGPAVPAWPEQPGVASVSAVLLDAAGAPLAGRDVAFDLDPASGSGLGPCNPTPCAAGATARSGATGLAILAARPGLAVGATPVTARTTDLHGTPVTGSPLALTLQAVAPPPGTVFAAFNALRSSGTAGLPGPAWSATTGAPGAIAMGASGAVYVAGGVSSAVYRIDPSGLTTLAMGAVTGVRPSGLAVDEAGGRLYVADQLADAIWTVDLITGGVLGRVAGGGTSSVDGPATATSLGGPVRIRFASGRIWVMDRTPGLGRLRRVDPVAGTIDTYLANLSSRALGGPADLATSCSSATRLTWSGLSTLLSGQSTLASAAFAPNGTVYLSGQFCGPPIGTSVAWSIARVEADGTLTLVAGLPGFGLSDGSAGSITGFDALAGAMVSSDASGNLWIVLPPFAGSGTFSVPTVVGYFAADGSGTVGPTSIFHKVGKGSIVGADYLDEAGVLFQQSAVDLVAGTHAWLPESTHDVRLIW